MSIRELPKLDKKTRRHKFGLISNSQRFSTSARMELRNHPLMSYRGVCNWPPSWMWRGSPKESQIKNPRGEIGILKEVFLSKVDPKAKIFLIIEHENEEYIGCLIFSDSTFCEQMYAVLSACIGHSTSSIGSLDVSHLV